MKQLCTEPRPVTTIHRVGEKANLFYCCNNFIYCQPTLIITLQERVHIARPQSRTSTSYETALWTNGISWISAVSRKSLESGERDFELV